MELPTSILYYRLRQVDIDGKFTYSIVVAIKTDRNLGEPEISVYPNPFNESITIRVVAVNASDETDQVALYSLDGRIVYQRKIAQRGSATILLEDLPSLTPGIYLLKTTINGKMYTLKLIRK
jgi:hypothetical protein